MFNITIETNPVVIQLNNYHSFIQRKTTHTESEKKAPTKTS